ncbi:Hypothetical protein NGAL_HAMBI490_56180 [Neorhizobium galegae bv. officinalis]|nr:Hypothetical protein NGAL_HAMBI490_56180 [Neorhizobium galegae bv. officinalis]
MAVYTGATSGSMTATPVLPLLVSAMTVAVPTGDAAVMEDAGNNRTAKQAAARAGSLVAEQAIERGIEQSIANSAESAGEDIGAALAFLEVRHKALQNIAADIPKLFHRLLVGADRVTLGMR